MSGRKKRTVKTVFIRGEKVREKEGRRKSIHQVFFAQREIQPSKWAGKKKKKRRRKVVVVVVAV